MSDYKLIAFDMDGTLLDSKKQILPSSLESMKEAHRQGKYVCLCTGRCPAELEEYLEVLPNLDYVIGVSGALVYCARDGKKIYENCLEPETVRQIVDIVQQEDVMLQFLCGKSMVEKEKSEHLDRYGMGKYQELYNRVTDGREDLYGDYCNAPFPLEKVNVYHTDPEARLRSRRRLEEAGVKVTIVDSEITSLEINAQGVNKGIGLTYLSRYLGIPLEETIAVGDADNDLEVLKTAGLAVAMGNANESVKRIAQVVVADCDHGGCAEAVEKYLL